MRRPTRVVLAAALAWAGLGPAARAADAPRKAPAVRALPGEEALRKARAGRYTMLLRQIRVPQDAGRFGDFHDLGHRAMPTYAGFNDLPTGYWVYVYPHWYIWRDRAGVPRPRRNWGPEQATGAPDTPVPGDVVTAWASATPDGQDEWLLLEYAEPVVPTAVLVYETFNPGALSRVTAFRLDGREVEVWKGKDPTPTTAAKGVSEVPVHVRFKTNRVKIYLDSKAVPGWNEIDAVGLRDSGERVHWAVHADASSTFADQGGVIMLGGAGGGVVVVQPAAPPAPAPPPGPAPALPAAPARVRPAIPGMPAAPGRADPTKRIERLEKEVRELRKEIEGLKAELRKRSGDK